MAAKDHIHSGTRVENGIIGVVDTVELDGVLDCVAGGVDDFKLLDRTEPGHNTLHHIADLVNAEVVVRAGGLDLGDNGGGASEPSDMTRDVNFGFVEACAARVGSVVVLFEEYEHLLGQRQGVAEDVQGVLGLVGLGRLEVENSELVDLLVEAGLRSPG